MSVRHHTLILFALVSDSVVDERLESEAPSGGDSLHDQHHPISRLNQEEEPGDEMSQNNVSDSLNPYIFAGITHCDECMNALFTSSF